MPRSSAHIASELDRFVTGAEGCSTTSRSSASARAARRPRRPRDEAGLRYVALEQNNTLSTIDLYPKGKYIFFKPDTKDWFGGIPAAGLGLAKAKYGAADTDDDQTIYEAIGAELSKPGR